MTGSGILVVDKTAGVTSFDAVSLVRRRLGVRRVGHAGTLDPAATGVLPILIGEATKLTPFLMDEDKEYRATVRLGVTTDTHDLTGRVLAEVSPAGVTRTALEAACRPLVGRIRQVPPMYSAVHHAGRRLYELAREGIEVEREPRDVVVHAIEVEAFAEGTAALRIVCGKGTYVRALAADLGHALGTGAAVQALQRTRVGVFALADAVPWPVLSDAAAGVLWARVLPPESALARWPVARLDEAGARRFAHGQSVEWVEPADTAARFVRVHDEDGRFLGVGEAMAGGRLRPVRMLNADRSGTSVLPA